ncbi:MFS transporter [Comamonas testosteroni]|uniref:MFS transporter n=1 Tax=Comamonas testosteroni TaxID=285 RepID=UPI0023AA5355|nr:MFS transporter [Comamonas testosteroni]WEE79792.1 MFS transporter [Comamonas testosteroni]
MSHQYSKRSRLALMLGHCAGMIDLVALPIWVGALIAHYHFDPQQAGMLASLFLVGAVIASVALAPRFDRLPVRLVATTGFGIAALGFAAASTTQNFAVLAMLHALCGMASGSALSVTHGSIARSANPHRMFAVAGIALGVFAIVFLGAVPQVIASKGGASLFFVFAIVMTLGALCSAWTFPAQTATSTSSQPGQLKAIDRTVWYGICGIACMGLVQAMTFSFLERAGSDKGFAADAITGVLIALGVVNLFPAAFAAVLEKRWNARWVLLAGPVVQAMLVIVIVQATAFTPYAVAASVFAAVMIFTHTFAFGVLARLDNSGRAMAATPAMLMTGAAIGPVLGGTLVKTWGYSSLGVTSAVIAVVAVVCFSRIPASTGAVQQEVTA